MVRSWQARYFFILKITLLCVMGISMGQLTYPYNHQQDMIEPNDRYPPYNPMMSFHQFEPHFHDFPHSTMHDLHSPFYRANPQPPTMPIHSMPSELAQVGSNDINPSIPADTCQLQMDHGSCTDMLPRYFYDINARECQPFTYGGCDGNANNFITMEECENACLGHFSSHVSFRTHPPIMDPSNFDHDLFYRSHRPSLCYQPKKKGPCLAWAPRYYYNPRSGECERFNYGGCAGNANRFSTYYECKRFCKAHEHHFPG